MVGLAVRDPDAGRDSIVEFVVLAFLGGVGAFVMGAILECGAVAGCGCWFVRYFWGRGGRRVPAACLGSWFLVAEAVGRNRYDSWRDA